MAFATVAHPFNEQAYTCFCDMLSTPSFITKQDHVNTPVGSIPLSEIRPLSFRDRPTGKGARGRKGVVMEGRVGHGTMQC